MDKSFQLMLMTITL